MTPPVQRKWSVAKLACGCAAAALAAVLLVVFLFVGGGLALFAAWTGGEKWRKDEHAAWPKPTPVAALATRSPTGRFITSAGKNNGDGDRHSDRHDCIWVGPAACPDYGQEFTAQDHAWCETDDRACSESDGRLMGERFGVALRWINATDVEVSWTELAALDPAKHRIWRRASETYRVTEIQNDRSGDCLGRETHVESLPSPPGR